MYQRNDSFLINNEVLVTLVKNLENLCQDREFWIVLLFGLLVFCQNSGVPGFFHDGYLYAAFGKNAAIEGRWLIPHLAEFLYKEFYQHLPFAFILEGAFFKLFPPNFLTARLFGLVFPLIVLIHLYISISKVSKVRAFWTSILFCLIPPLLKKSRFPNIDTQMMCMFYFFTVFYWEAYVGDKWKNWILAGLFFGLAMLLKGPFALYLPGIAFLHMLFSSREKLLSIKTWSAVLLGGLIFSIWPVSLWIIDRFDVFETWVNSTFLHNILNKREFSGTHFYDYFVFSLKQFPHMILMLIGCFWISAKKLKEYSIFNAYFFLVYVLLISIPKVKYSNYLIMVYPALAVACGYFLSEKLGQIAFNRGRKFFSIVTVCGLLLLSIFPVGDKIRRDREIFSTIELTRKMKKPPLVWGIVDGAYPYYALANLMGFTGDASVFDLSLAKATSLGSATLSFQNDFNQSLEFPKDTSFLLLVKKESLSTLLSGAKVPLVPLLEFEKRGMVVVVRKDAFREGSAAFVFE